MNLVGSKEKASSELCLTERTTSLSYWQIVTALAAKARHLAILDYLEGTRTVQTKTDCPSQEVHFKACLDKETRAKATQTIKKWKEFTLNDPLLQEALRVQNNPGDPNPLPQGKPKSPQEAIEWRSQVAVSKQSVMQYIKHRNQVTLEGPTHEGSKAIVAEFCPPQYFSVYSDNLSEEEMARALAAKPLDAMQLEYYIDLEARNDTSIVRYSPGDDVSMIKSKIVDLSTAEKLYVETDALWTKNSLAIDKLNGDLEAFLLAHMPIAESICPEELRQKKYAQVWKLVNEHFVAKAKRAPSTATALDIREFNSRVDSVASWRKNQLGVYLAQKQVVGQEAHVGSRDLKKVTFLEASNACLLLTDVQWNTKYPPLEWAGKETKDVHIRELLRAKFENTPLLFNRITIEERSNPDVAAKTLLEALIHEESLHSFQKMLDNTILKTSVNAVSSASSGGEEQLLDCDVHGKGGHDTANCKMLKQGTVVYDNQKKSYVYKDSGVTYKGAKSSHSDKTHSEGPKTKKGKQDHKSHEKEKKKEKKDPKDNKKDKQKEKEKQKEKKKHSKVIAALDGLKTTFVNLIQNQTTSSSTAVAAPATAQAAPPQDGTILAALDKHFVDLKKSIGIEDP